jgi:hypothetical protein
VTSVPRCPPPLHWLAGDTLIKIRLQNKMASLHSSPFIFRTYLCVRRGPSSSALIGWCNFNKNIITKNKMASLHSSPFIFRTSLCVRRGPSSSALIGWCNFNKNIITENKMASLRSTDIGNLVSDSQGCFCTLIGWWNLKYALWPSLFEKCIRSIVDSRLIWFRIIRP